MRKTKWIICYHCEGHGSVENPAFENGFTGSEWAEMTEEEQYLYFSGEYNVPCGDCAGKGKLEVPNVAALSFKEKRELVLQRQHAREEAEIDLEIEREIAAERRMGC